MPLIQVKLIENVFSPEQKQQIVRRLTDAMVEIEGENMRPVTWCVIDEVKSGDWGDRRKPLDHGGRQGARRRCRRLTRGGTAARSPSPARTSERRRGPGGRSRPYRRRRAVAACRR